MFPQPAAAAVGLTEPAALAADHDAVVFRARFRPMRYALGKRDEQVVIKVVVDRMTDRVLGVHMIGCDAPEIIQTVAIVVTMGATKADLDRTFALHPTTAEELVLLRLSVPAAGDAARHAAGRRFPECWAGHSGYPRTMANRFTERI